MKNPYPYGSIEYVCWLLRYFCDLPDDGTYYTHTSSGIKWTQSHADFAHLNKEPVAPATEPEPSDINITAADIDLELREALGYVPKVRKE